VNNALLHGDSSNRNGCTIVAHQTAKQKAFGTRQKNIGAQHTLLLCADADF